MAEQNAKASKSGCNQKVKMICCASTVVVCLIVVGIAIKYRFTVRSEVNKIVTGNEYPIIGDESIMSPKAHGTTEKPV